MIKIKLGVAANRRKQLMYEIDVASLKSKTKSIFTPGTHHSRHMTKDIINNDRVSDFSALP